MPESSCTHTYKRNASYPLAMESPINSDVSYESVKDSNGAMEKSDRTMSVESLNTLLSKLPEISIPPTLYNPLPLQCLAASALPEGVRAEIDGVIAQFSDCPVSSECSASPCTMSESTDSVAEEGSSMMDKDVDSLTAALHKALGIEELVSPTSTSNSVGSVSKVTIQRDTEWETHGGFGLKLCGGVRCNNCSSLHAVVTDVSPTLYCAAEKIVEGVCVVEWNGHSLDECTYEEVQRIVGSVSPGISEIEISVKKCGENFPISQCGFDWLPSFATVRLNKRRNAVFESKRDSDCKSTISEDSSGSTTIPSSPSHLHTRPRDLLDLPLTDPPPSAHQGSVSRSPSPSEPRRPLAITIPKSDETTEALLRASTEARPKSPKSLDSILSKLPNGMVQLSLEYNNEFEELNISLLQVKGQSSKEFSDVSDVFINTYLVPDYRGQGVRNIMSSQARKDSTEYHNNSYMLAPDEVSSVALRVILWDAHKSRNIVFRGEVLLGLSDQQIVNLTSEPTWYTLCPEDPNLSKLPPPVHFKHKSSVDTLLQKLKQKAHSLTVVRPLKQSTSLSSELKSTSMLSLPGSVEKRSMTLLRKKQRKETRKTHSGSFSPQLVDPVLPGEVNMKSCLKEPCRQQKLSSILNVLRESKEDLTETTKTISEAKKIQRGKTHPLFESTDGGSLDNRLASHGQFSTVDRRQRKRGAPVDTQRLSYPGKVRENGGSNQNFLEELEKMMSQENLGLQPTPVRMERMPVKEEQVHYKLIDGRQSDDELTQSPGKYRDESIQLHKSNDCLRYPAEVSLHKITVEDVDRVTEAKKKSRTLPVDCTSYPRPITLLPTQGELDKRPPKPPKNHRSKSVDNIEKLGSEEELFIVRSQHSPGLVPAEYRYSRELGSVDALDSVEPLDGNSHELSSLDFGNRYNHFMSSDCLDESVDRHDDITRGSPDEDEGQKRLTKSKWKSLEDLLGHKGKKSKGKSKSQKISAPQSHSTVLRTNSENGTNVSPGNVKLEFQFNDLNRAHPVLLVKLTDVVLTSRKLLSSDLLMKCYITHVSTGVCILKDRTTVSMKNYSPSLPLGILQFGTDIANLSVQVLLCVGSKVFSRKVIGQVSVDLAALDLSGGKAFTQWFLLSKPTHTG